MSEILKEFDDIVDSRGKKSPSFYIKIFTLLIVVVAFGIYIGDMLFGKSSLDVLLDLKTQKSNLQINVENLKNENAVLQKEYFELKELDPEQ